MKYCRRCLYPENHPLGLTFDSNGICSGCLIHEEKDQLDWDSKRKRLEEILSEYRSTSGKVYDCIIPVSGGRDSYFIVDLIKNEFRMNPLLVTYNKHYNTKVGIRNLAYLRTLFDCDLVMKMVSAKTVKKLTKHTLGVMGSMYWHCLAGQTVYPIETAVRLRSPLIIWGAHQGVDQVGMFSHEDEVEMTRKYRKDHDLMGWEAEDLISEEDGISEEDVMPFIYPHDKDLERIGIRGIYLNNFIRWDTKAQHEKMIERFNYKTAKKIRTFDSYNDVDCVHYSGLHDYIKEIKWGYGKVVDHATRELRLRRLNRKDAILRTRGFSGVDSLPSDSEVFFEWLGIGKSDFHFIIDGFRDHKLWRKDGPQGWVRRSKAYEFCENQDEFSLGNISQKCGFTSNEEKNQTASISSYTTFGKGHTD